MIITCPDCATSYRSEATSIGSNGRTVRCAKCKSTWFVPAPDADMASDALALEDLSEKAELLPTVVTPDAPLTATVATAAAAGAHVTLRDKSDADKLARRRRLIRLIWAIPLLILAIAAILAIVFRQDIVNRMPKSATLYETLGLQTKLDGLSIESPTASTALTGEGTLLVVRSAVRNLGTEAANIPMIELSLHNPSGERLAQWFVTPDKSQLAAGERLKFTTQYPDPPIDATGLRYKFAEQ